MKKLKSVFLENTPFMAFLLTTLLAGLSYGLYKGVIDNYLAEIIGATEMDKGITEFFREMPGALLVFLLAAVYTVSAENLYKAGAAVMLGGLLMHAAFPPGKVLITIAILIYSTGEHIQLGMRSTLTLNYAARGRGGEALGYQNSANQIGSLIGLLVISACIGLFPAGKGYTFFFYVTAAIMALTFLVSLRITGNSQTDENKRRFYFHKKYKKYYMLEIFYGARKQVFFTFGPYVLILFYGADAASISLLFAVAAVASFLLAPVVGKIIDRVGYKTVMITDTLILVIVCFFYGFAHHIFEMKTAYYVCCVNYVLDAVISLASMASNVYVQDLADSEDEMKATISTGLSVNHLITIFIALFGGWIWKTLGIETLFILSAVLGLCNSAYAATIKPNEGRGKLNERRA